MQSDQLNYIPILMQLVLSCRICCRNYNYFWKIRPKRSSVIKDKNFECGVESVGNARIPFSVKYFLGSYSFCIV